MLDSINPPTSVLFLGSGFSIGAENLEGESPPVGIALRNHFRDELKLPEDVDYDLRVLADEFGSHPNCSMYRELYRLFTVSKLSDVQRDILKEDWLRIYTTNFDDVVEIAHHGRHIPVRSFSYDDDVPNRLDKNMIVHLHGSVRALTEQNVLQQLVLSENSYVRQHFEQSAWYTQFQGDLRFCSNCFFVGYSLSDYHISALLLQNPAVASKTFFIQPADIDDIFIRRVSAYGEVLRVGTDGFAKLTTSLPRPNNALSSASLKAFRYLNPVRDKKALRDPTAMEVLNLLIFGAFNYTRCLPTSEAATYVIPRAEKIEQIHGLLKNNRSIVIDSRLGNGKTVLLYLLFLYLSEKGFLCFMYRDQSPNIQAELDFLRTQKNVVIFFDNYTIGQEVMRKVASDLSDAKIVVEIRTGIYEVRYHEVSEKIPGPYERVSLNRLSNADIRLFKELCRKSGIDTSQIDFSRAAIELRELLLQLFDSPNIKSRISDTLGPLFENSAARKLLLLSLLLSRFQLPADATFIRSVTDVDAYRELKAFREIADEVFRVEDDQIQIRSAIFSDYAVRHFVAPSEVMATIYEAAISAAARKEIRQYRVFMSNLMQFANLQDILRGDVDLLSRIITLYERLRFDERVNDEPLFWLQYALAMIESENLLFAEEFLKTAYARAADRPSFKTYQLDTQSLRLLLLIEAAKGSGEPVSRLAEILDRLELVNSMLGEESHRSFAIRVLENVDPFVRARASDLDVPEKTALTFWISKIVNTLSDLTPEYRALTGSDTVKQSLIAAKHVLL